MTVKDTEMVGNNQNADDSQLHWFWKLTTKWWFFPVFYISLSLVAFLISVILVLTIESTFDMDDALLILITMPAGVIILLENIPAVSLGWSVFVVMQIFIVLFYIYFICCFATILYYRYKKNTILKKNIVILLLVIILSFLGTLLLIAGNV